MDNEVQFTMLLNKKQTNHVMLFSNRLPANEFKWDVRYIIESSRGNYGKLLDLKQLT